MKQHEAKNTTESPFRQVVKIFHPCTTRLGNFSNNKSWKNINPSNSNNYFFIELLYVGGSLATGAQRVIWNRPIGT